MKAHVVTILGGSPAVVSELLWWLTVQEETEIVGLEIWTTVSLDGGPAGATALRAAVEAGLWAQLAKACGEASARLPRGPVPGEVIAPQDLPVGSALARTAVVGFQREDGEWLEDIRESEDADVVARQLHDRVRELRRTLSDDVQLIGSLAGGRKTMSAAFQGAFELQARARDRLVHVLVHPKIEADRDLLKTFVAPSEAVAQMTGVPVEDQLTIYDVPYPLVRELVVAHPRRGGSLAEAFEEESYAELLGRLREVSGAHQVRATLRDFDHGRKPFRLTVTGSTGAGSHASLSEAEALVYAAIVSFGPDGAPGDEIAARLDGVDQPWTDYTDSQSPGAQRLRSTVSRLRKALRKGLAAYPELMVETVGRGEGRYRVEAALHIDGAEGLLGRR